MLCGTPRYDLSLNRDSRVSSKKGSQTLGKGVCGYQFCSICMPEYNIHPANRKRIMARSSGSWLLVVAAVAVAQWQPTSERSKTGLWLTGTDGLMLLWREHWQTKHEHAASFTATAASTRATGGHNRQNRNTHQMAT